MSLKDQMRRAKAPPAAGARLVPPPLPPWSPGGVPPPTAVRAPAAVPPPRTPARPAPLTILFDEKELDRFRTLPVFARTLVEGWLAGRHKSPHHGFSSEFAGHKAWTPGEAVERMDWRVYARSRRLFVRKFEDETDLTVHLLVDASGSMAYLGRGQQKQWRAARIAAALAWLMVRQGDRVSLTLFDEKAARHLPAGGTRRHLLAVLRALEEMASQTAAGRTDVPRALRDLGAHVRRRSRLVVLSDFLGTDHKALFDELGRFRHRGFEVLLLQVVDPDELELPEASLAQFVDMETGERVQVEPEEIRGAYRRETAAFMEGLRAESMRRRIRHHVLRTTSPWLEAMEAWTGHRGP
jgi:uncharacterized protein (DUF58 family)